MSDDENPVAKFLRLQNGDDVIAEVVETEDEDGILYTLFHPLKVVYMPSDSVGYLSVAFMPWVFPRICEQQEFVIHAEDVMMVVDVSPKMNTYYWESVESYMNRTSDKVEEAPQEQDDTINEESLQEILEEMYSKRTYH